jgi:hypothetical protein
MSEPTGTATTEAQAATTAGSGVPTERAREIQQHIALARAWRNPELVAAWEQELASEQEREARSSAAPAAKAAASRPAGEPGWSASLDGHHGALVAAAERFRDGKARLLTSDGRPLYAEEEHARRMQGLAESFNRVVEAAVAAADRIRAAAELVITVAEHQDLLDALSGPEQAAAANKAGFVREDAERLPAAQLVARLEAVAAEGDRASAYLWARYVGQRVEAATLAAHRHERADLSAQECAQVRTVVADLRRKVLGERGRQRIEAARKAVADARLLRKTAAAISSVEHDVPGQIKQRMVASGRYAL